MTDVDAVELEPCPCCGDVLEITKSKMAVHSQQNHSSCILGSMGIPTDHPETVAKWNTRAAIAALPPAVPDVTPDPAEAHVDGWRVRVIEWVTDETVKVVQCKGERQAEKVERGMGINMASEYYTEIDNKPRTTTITTTPDPVASIPTWVTWVRKPPKTTGTPDPVAEASERVVRAAKVIDTGRSIHNDRLPNGADPLHGPAWDELREALHEHRMTTKYGEAG